MQTVVGLRFLRALAREGEATPAYMQDQRKTTQHADRPSVQPRGESGRTAAFSSRVTPR